MIGVFIIMELPFKALVYVNHTYYDGGVDVDAYQLLCFTSYTMLYVVLCSLCNRMLKYAVFSEIGRL